MGCLQSTLATPATEAPEKPAAAAASASSPDKPRPMVFAIMRNGHEVIRGSMKDIQAAVDAQNMDEAMETYGKLDKWMHLHKLMEEGHPNSTETPMGMFRLLDQKFDNVASKAGLLEDHQALDEVETETNRAVESKDGEAFCVAYAKLQQLNLSHLEKEESIMMPKVSQMAKEGVNMKQLMRDELLALILDSPDLEHFVKYANEVLERHADNMPRARVFDHALWAVSTADEWQKYDAWIQETVSEEQYREISDAINA